ncbi:hypothetical protein [Legionella jamestowniensis]|uniref:Uncharacterized protein n=1 Tax=Legionella jamestowniensis TaxID=455 RepID=A0A0W0UGL1_9GAMM|nr:hypothetical protein [Legionella jamestowniensis]KTD07056.1 hypothetical protein Ljam_1251 [Legionella jamestowniensis]OCH97647.1 hypothetical protein A8135_13640 [Legionella jamestowniensis]SFM03150.1 hypothetical protein SAMN02746073_0029 [Legionella jamestowniensis DSM 19215]
MYRLFKSTFNTNNRFYASMQVVNLAAFGAASVTLLTDPEASFAEFGLDALTHALSYLALSDTQSMATEFGSTVINLIRLGAIYAGMTTAGCSEVPVAAAAVDALVHLTNSGASLVKFADAAEAASQSHRQTAPTMN